MIPVSPAELAMFAQIDANHPRFLEYLKALRADAVNVVVQSSDIQAIHRAQGMVILLDQQINLLVSANKHLRSSN